MALDLGVPEGLPGLLRLGTCSWKYDSWKGLVYEPGKTYRAGRLSARLRQAPHRSRSTSGSGACFPGGVQVPDPAVVRRYATACPDDFRLHRQGPERHHADPFLRQADPRTRSATANKPNPHFLSVDLLRRVPGNARAHAGRSSARSCSSSSTSTSRRCPRWRRSWSGSRVHREGARRAFNTPSRSAIRTISRGVLRFPRRPTARLRLSRRYLHAPDRPDPRHVQARDRVVPGRPAPRRRQGRDRGGNG